MYGVLWCIATSIVSLKMSIMQIWVTWASKITFKNLQLCSIKIKGSHTPCDVTCSRSIIQTSCYVAYARGENECLLQFTPTVIHQSVLKLATRLFGNQYLNLHAITHTRGETKLSLHLIYAVNSKEDHGFPICTVESVTFST